MASAQAFAPLSAQPALPTAGRLDWTTLNEDGKDTGDVTLALENANGQVRAEFSSGGKSTGIAFLDATGQQQKVEFSLPDGRTLSLSPSSDGSQWNATGAWEGHITRDASTVIGDPSMFLAIPHLLRYTPIGEERRIRMLMPQDGRLVGMTLRYKGDSMIATGAFRGSKAHVVEMRLSDPLGRLVWPYALVFMFRAEDGLMLRFENVDGKGRRQTMELKSAEGLRG